MFKVFRFDYTKEMIEFPKLVMRKKKNRNSVSTTIEQTSPNSCQVNENICKLDVVADGDTRKNLDHSTWTLNWHGPLYSMSYCLDNEDLP